VNSLCIEYRVVSLTSAGVARDQWGAQNILPNVRIPIFTQTLIVETIDLCDLPRLVVSSQDGNTLRVADFKGDKKGYCFDGVVPSINVIT